MTFDLDAVDDPAHGHQQLTFWHAYYDQNQYLPLVVTCAENDQFVMVVCGTARAPAALGADDDLDYLVTRLRAVWPDVRIHLRGDGGFGVPTMYEVCERLEISYTFGLSTNAVLQRASEELLAEAVRLWDETHDTATAVRGVLVSGRFLAGVPLCGGQGGGERARDEPPLRGDESAGGVARSGSDV